MILRLLFAFAVSTLIIGDDFSTSAQPSQSTEPPKCSVSLFKGRNPNRRAKILDKPDPEYTAAERRTHRHSEIILRAVLCGTGEVTDVVIKSGLGPSIDAKAVAAAQKIKFVPGEHDGQPISTLVLLVYRVK
jgi:hypothetical protein